MTEGATAGPLVAVRLRRPLLGVAPLLLAGCMAAAGSTVGATVEARPAVLRPAPSQTYLDLGRTLLAQREPELALRAFNASLSLEGVTPEAMVGAGLAARQQGLRTLARRYFEHARKLAPGSPMVQNDLGVVLFELGRYYEAREALRAAWRLSGEQSDVVRRNLDRVEAAIARVEAGQGPDPAATVEVVRLGSDLFRLQPTSPAEDMMGEE